MYHTFPTVVLLSTAHQTYSSTGVLWFFSIPSCHVSHMNVVTYSFFPHILSSPLVNLASYLPHTPDSLTLSSQLLSSLIWTMVRSHLWAPCSFWELLIQHREGCFWTMLMPFLVQPSSAFLHTWNKIYSSLHGPWRLSPLTHRSCASPMSSTFLTSALFPLQCFDQAVLYACNISSTYSGGTDLTPGFPLLPCCHLCRVLFEFQSLSSPCPCNSLHSP